MIKHKKKKMNRLQRRNAKFDAYAGDDKPSNSEINAGVRAATKARIVGHQMTKTALVSKGWPAVCRCGWSDTDLPDAARCVE